MLITKKSVLHFIFGLVVVFSSLKPVTVRSQQSFHQRDSNHLQALQIGQTVPDITFQKVLNSSSRALKLVDLRGKLVILDMWASFCSACIQSFPKMNKLQQQFFDKIQILLCNPHPGKNDTEEKILELLKKNQKRDGFYPTLPIPIEDTILNHYFPHNSLPHVVWINGVGKVAAITRSEAVTAENILAILNSENVKLTEKKDFLFNREIPLFLEGNGGAENYIFRTILTPQLKGFGTTGGTRTNSEGKIVGAFEINLTLKELIKSAYSDLISRFNTHTTIYDISENGPPNNVENRYCYDIIVPPVSTDSFFSIKYPDILKSDLKKYFNISYKINKRKLKYYIISINSFNKGIRITNARSGPAIFRYNGPDIYVRNYSPETLTDLFSGLLGCPAINSFPANLKDQRIGFDFPKNFNLQDKKTILEYLRQIGFKITSGTKEFEILSLTDKDSSGMPSKIN